MRRHRKRGTPRLLVGLVESDLAVHVRLCRNKSVAALSVGAAAVKRNDLYLESELLAWWRRCKFVYLLLNKFNEAGGCVVLLSRCFFRYCSFRATVRVFW